MKLDYLKGRQSKSLLMACSIASVSGLAVGVLGYYLVQRFRGRSGRQALDRGYGSEDYGRMFGRDNERGYGREFGSGFGGDHNRDSNLSGASGSSDTNVSGT